MREYMDSDFLLMNETAKTLYRNAAKDQPIFDFHCHLSPKEIYEDHTFSDLTEAWLGGDHYKWRMMRAMGIDESLITGQADPREKLRAYAKTVSYAIGNPLHHWSHLELRHFFGIQTLLSEETADEIYDEATKQLQTGLTARKMMEKSGVRCVFTTDDPCDDLKYHELIAQDPEIKVQVRPAFRPDRFLAIELPSFKVAMEQLQHLYGQSIQSFEALKEALDQRVTYFKEHGCQASDHALSSYVYEELSESELDEVLQKALSGEALTAREANGYRTALLLHLSERYNNYGWPMELHVQPIRNNNPRMYEKLGPDTGFDSILDGPISLALNRLLGAMNRAEHLPKTLLFSLNPSDLMTLATAMGNFQEGPVRGKMQLGVPWWFNDTKEGMEEHLRVYARVGMLATCVGMLTDSRSFLSYPRHDYFRRILCQYIGEQIEQGFFPADLKLAESIVRDICFKNAAEYFGLEQELLG